MCARTFLGKSEGSRSGVGISDGITLADPHRKSECRAVLHAGFAAAQDGRCLLLVLLPSSRPLPLHCHPEARRRRGKGSYDDGSCQCCGEEHNWRTQRSGIPLAASCEQNFVRSFAPAAPPAQGGKAFEAGCSALYSSTLPHHCTVSLTIVMGTGVGWAAVVPCT